MYVCSELAVRPNIYGEYACKHWTVYSDIQNIFNEFAQLSLSDISTIWASVLLLFSASWCFKHMAFFIRRR